MIKLRKISAIATVVAAAGLFCSIGMVENTKSVRGGYSSIWSTKEKAYSSTSIEDTQIYSMQGESIDSEIDYDRVLPISSHSNDISVTLDSNFEKLDLAMSESREIMRSLNSQSAGYIGGGQIDLLKEQEMSIDEFEMQNIEPKNKSISSGYSNQVITEVDITLPKKFNASIDCKKNLGSISSATMKVVDVLLKHGEDARALSMIERELLGFEMN